MRDEADVRSNAKTLAQFKKSVSFVKTELAGHGNDESEFYVDVQGNDFERIVTQDEFEREAIEPLRNRLTKPLEDIFMKEEVTNEGITKDNIDEVLMVGGSVRIPMVQDIVRQFFPSTTTMNISSYPDECVAHGAAYYAHMIKNTPEEDWL